MKTVCLLLVWIVILTSGCQKVNSHEIEGFPYQNLRAIIIHQYGQDFMFIKRNGVLGYDYKVHFQKNEYPLSKHQFQAVYGCVNNIQKNIHLPTFQKMLQICEENEKHWAHLRNTSLSVFLYTGNQNRHYEY